MNIDHHLQSKIIEKLAKSNIPIAYTSLKEGDIENSLFSYHLNKLIKQKIVEKSEDGYSLTMDGARWLNDRGDLKFSAEKPRVNVMLVIKDQHGNFLIAQRTGQLKNVINDFMLPSHYYVNDLDLPDQVDLAIESYIPEGSLKKKSDFGFAQIRVDYPDKSMHNLFYLTHCEVNHFEPLNPYFELELEWMTKQQIDEIVHPSATILREILKYTANAKNARPTPLFLS